MKRYELTDETKTVKSAKGKVVVVHRIRAITDLLIIDKEADSAYTDDYDVIKAGTLGGWVESEENLCQESLAWIMDEAIAFGRAYVMGAALVSGEAILDGDTTIEGSCQIFDHAHIEAGLIGDSAKIYGNAHINGAIIIDEAEVFGNAKISAYAAHQSDGDIYVEGEAKIYENATLCNFSGYEFHVDGHARIHGEAEIEAAGSESLCIDGMAEICDKAQITGAGHIGDRAVIKGCSVLDGRFMIYDHAVINIAETSKWHEKEIIESHAVFAGHVNITGVNDYLVVGPFKGKYASLHITFVADANGEISLSCDFGYGFRHDRIRYLEAPDNNELRNELKKESKCAEFAEDAISGALAAYDYAKALFKRRRNQKQETADPTQDTHKLPENPII